MRKESIKAVIYAVVAALFYALNVPCSKMLLLDVPPTYMAGFLYMGAGVGVGLMYLFHYRAEKPEERLCRKDMPYTVGMVLLDIIAPILLMIGVSIGTSANASLLGNFEIVATTLIALLVFREAVSKRLWAAIGFITLSSVILSFESGGTDFSIGSLFVIGATLCWGLENNCTRNISEKSTYQIVTVKGIFCGAGSLAVAFLLREEKPELKYVIATMLLGFIAYGLSIFTYIRAQKTLGAAKTSAYYAIAPFLGVFLSFILLKEPLTASYAVALAVMVLGTGIIVYDTLLLNHKHEHQHVLTHTHNGTMHMHIITHSHPHNHLANAGRHSHTHSIGELENCLKNHPATAPGKRHFLNHRRREDTGGGG